MGLWCKALLCLPLLGAGASELSLPDGFQDSPSQDRSLVDERLLNGNWTMSSSMYALDHEKQTLVQIFDGLTQAFFHTDTSHAQCITDNIAGIEEESRVAIVSIVKAFQDLFHGDIKDMSSKVAVIVQSYQKFFTSWQTLSKACLAHEQDVMKTLLQNLQSLQFIGGHLMANGMDIVQQVGDAMLHFHDLKFREFGTDIGLSLRKIFLSHADSTPEGPPKGKVLQDMTVGLVSGFFGPGVRLDLIGSDGKKKVIDLHQCVSENEGYFMGVWELAWKFFASLAAGGWDGIKAKTQSWEEGLVVLVVGAPVAFGKCGVGGAQQAMLKDVASHLGNITMAHTAAQLKTAFKVNPHAVFTDGVGFQRDAVTVEMAEAIKGWSQNDWKMFGEHLGMLVRELIMLVVPQEYSVDDNHVLHRKLALDEEQPQESSFHASAGLALLTTSLLAGVVAFAWRHKRRIAYQSCACSADTRAARAEDMHFMEAGDDEYVE